MKRSASSGRLSLSKTNPELIDLSKQILDLTKEVHAHYRSGPGPSGSATASSDAAK